MAGQVEIQDDTCAADASSFCPNCVADLAHLPPIARFCHRCGSRLPPGLAGRKVRPLHGPLEAHSVLFSHIFGPSLILCAYGKALFNLGFRYETAIGSRKNLHESLRCYQKAARLGDASAARRLSNWEGDADHPNSNLNRADPPPLPPEALADNPSPPPVAPPPLARVYHPPAPPS